MPLRSSRPVDADGAAQLLAAIVAGSSDAIIAKSPAGVILAWNRGAEEIYGYSAAETVGRPIELIVPPSHRDELREINDRVRRGERVDTLETVRRHKDGTLLSIALTLSPVVDAEGRVIAISAIARNITEQKATERALTESERRFRLLVENARDVVTRFRLDPAPGYEYVSPAIQRVLGYEPDEFYGRDGLALELIHPEDREALRRAVEGAWETQLTLRAVHKDGRLVWMERSQAVVRDASGEPVAIDAITRDVTAQHEAIAATLENERLLTALFDSALDALLIADDDRVYVRANAAASALFGLPVEEILGKRIDDFSAAGDPDLVEAAWRAYLEEGTQTGEFVLRRPDGEERVVEFAATASILPGRHLSVLRDVTEKRRAEAELQHTQALYRKVVENSKDMITLLEPDGTIVFASPSHEEILGRPVDDLVGGNVADLIHGDDVAGAAETLRLARQGRSVDSPVTRLWHADGGLVFVEGTAIPIVGGSEANLILATSRDVSSRVRAEQLEERLRQAEKLEAIGKLAGGIAHDFNNLLTAINGYSDLALASVPEGHVPLREGIEEIRRAGERAAELTRQLLAFSRQQALNPEPVDVNEAMSSSVTLLRRLLGEDIEVVTELAPGVPCALADSGQLMQVVLNLAVNARDAMPGGGVLRIGTGAVELGPEDAELVGVEPGRYVVLTVADSGLGIAEEIRERIFEPFFTTKEVGKGTGLGLATVHGIVAQSGGTIACTSSSAGTSFTIHLPAAAHARPEVPADEAAPRGSERVLLVEDDEMIRDVVQLMLRELGYEAVAAASPSEALELVGRSDPFDLLLTDVIMPHMNGHELACRVRERVAGIQVVYTSGYTGDVVLTRGVLADGDDFLQKPFTQCQLAHRLRGALDRAL